MKLWIGRHGWAGVPVRDPKQERERPLLPEGVATITAVAKAMKAVGEKPNTIFCSPFVRTTQTADIYGKILGVQVEIVDDLSPQRPIENRLAEFLDDEGAGELRRLMIVGHVDNTTPAFRNFGGDWPKLVMGEVRRVKIDRKSMQWAIKWRLRPSDLGLKDRAT